MLFAGSSMWLGYIGISMIIEKNVSQLAIGAYVVGIVKQKGNHKIKSPGWVRDFHVIDSMIHQGVIRVSVDTSKKLSADDGINQNDFSVSNLSETAKVTNKPHLIKRIDYSERLLHAKQLFTTAKALQRQVLSDIQNGQFIDAKPIIEVLTESIDLIFENSDALACVINIRKKDDYLLEHSISVSILISILGCYVGYDKTLVEDLAVGAFLHDVGKINIPDKVLNKPGKLTAAEFEVMKMHVSYSKAIVDEVSGVSEISRQIVANHHEKLNGTGYPNGLEAKDLSVFSRMIVICDIYDALTANRLYRQGVAQIKAFAILNELAISGELDSHIVNQFIKSLGVYPVGTLVKLNSNKLALVEKSNHQSPTKPLVKSFFSINQNVFVKSKEIDLSHEKDVRIEQGVRADDFNLDMKKITEFLLMEG